jgi:hypothetical protein
LVIKINTGGGKTVVGLLILRTCLNEGLGPALYVAPDNYLVSQVRQEAERLGLLTVGDPDDTRYVSGEAIGVVNIFTLMNGRSKFGGPGSPRMSPQPIGCLVVDDAHAALATTQDQYTITLPHDHALYAKLLELFADALNEQAPSQLLAIRDSDSASLPQQVPFWAWAKQADAVARLLQDYKDDPLVEWSWPLIRDHLAICHAVFTSRALEIRPPCPPVSSITSFREAKRRVFLTATLADDSVLVSTFDADPTSIVDPITPESAADLGDRMILAPQEINPEITEDDIKAAVRNLAETVNVVVLVPSARRSAYWGDVARVIANKDKIADTVDRLRREHLGLVVLVNKYDGIDLPGDACRVLVIDGLPEVYGGLDHREASVLGGSDSLFGRQMQRIEQGMGRGVRSASDYCVVLLIGSRLTQKVATPSLRQHFSPLTRAQLDLSKEIATRLSGTSMSELIQVIRQALDRDPEWVKVSREAVAQAKYPPGRVSPSVVAQREAFRHASIQQYQPAVKRLSEAINVEEDAGVRGILQEQMAAYAYFFDEAQAQQILAGALKANSRVLRPIRGFSYQRLSSTLDQAQSIAEFLAGKFSNAKDLMIGIDALMEDLEFDPERTDAFEDAMEELGNVLGFGSQRPERDTGNGPDVLWALGELQYLVIECKSGSTAREISRKEIQQLGHSMTWFADKYDQTCTGRPILVHPATQLAHNASAPASTRVITKSHLADLKSGVTSAVKALAVSASWADPDRIAEQIQHHRLSGRSLYMTIGTPPQAR